MKSKYSDLVAIFGFSTIAMAITLVMGYKLEYDMIDWVLLNTTSISILISYIVMHNRPLISLLFTLIEVCATILSTMRATKSNMDIHDLLWLILVLLVIIINISYIKIKDKSTNLLKYKRNIVKIPIWLRIVVYATLTNLVFGMANNENLVLLNNSRMFRIYSVIAIMMPTITMIARLTTSVLAYEMLAFQIIAEIFTLANLLLMNKANKMEEVWVILEIAVLVYCIIMTKMEDKKDGVKSEQGDKLNKHK